MTDTPVFKPVSVPVMITAKMRADLKVAGYTPAQIREMTPSEAWEKLGGMPSTPTPQNGNGHKANPPAQATTNANLDLALALAGRGWLVFPCREKQGQPFKNKRGQTITPEVKAPYWHKSDLRNGKDDATNDPAIIRWWWGRWPGALVGISCEASGFFAVDIDNKSGVNGFESWAALVETFGAAQPVEGGPYQTTPGGGAHLLFALPVGVKIPNNAGKLAPGVDLRSAGYICTGVLPDGRGYVWQKGHDFTAPLTFPPLWLIDRIEALTPKTADPKPTPQISQIDHTRGDGHKWLDDALAAARPGNRNNTGFTLACQLRDDGLSYDAALAIMQEYARRVPGSDYTEQEATASLEAAYKANPRPPAQRVTGSFGGNGHNGNGHQAQQDTPANSQALPAQATPPPTSPQPPDRFTLFWASEALEPQPPVDWVIDGLLTAGSLSAVVGDGGSKKTFSLLDMAVCVASGKDYWLGFPVKQGPVLFVDEESGPRRLKKRLNECLTAHFCGPDTPLACVSLAGFDLRNPDDSAALHRMILQIGARLVIVDALVDVMPGGNENDTAEIQPLMLALRHVAYQTGAAIVLIHHTNKNGGYRGSTALKGAVDLMLTVESKPNSEFINFATEKARDIEPVTFSARANFAPGQFWLTEAENQKQQIFTKAEQYVLRYLANNRPAPMPDIIGAADSCSESAATKAIYSLVTKGLVFRTNPDEKGRGSTAAYSLTALGVTTLGLSAPQEREQNTDRETILP